MAADWCREIVTVESPQSVTTDMCNDRIFPEYGIRANRALRWDVLLGSFHRRSVILLTMTGGAGRGARALGFR